MVKRNQEPIVFLRSFSTGYDHFVDRNVLNKMILKVHYFLFFLETDTL